MAWATIELRNVSPNAELVPEGGYTFELAPGSREDEQGRLILKAHIVSEGDFKGRPVTFSYPNPTEREWSSRMVRQLVESMGVEPQEGETTLSTLQRAAGSRFGAPIFHDRYTPEGGTEKVSAKLNIFKTYAAA